DYGSRLGKQARASVATAQIFKSLYQNLNGQGRPISSREGDRPTPALKKPLAVVRGVNVGAHQRPLTGAAAVRCSGLLCGAMRTSSIVLDVLAEDDSYTIEVLDTKLSNPIGLICGL